MDIRPTPANAIDVDGVAGKIRAIVTPKGTLEDNFNKLGPAKEALISFYDLRYPHIPDGQFTGGRYYVSTILHHHSQGKGLILHGGVPNWTVEGPEMIKVCDFLKEMFGLNEKPSMSTPVKWKKGQRVEFVMNKQSYLGTVEKGGAGKISVVVDGGKNSVSGPAQAFKPSNIPLPKDEPSLMDLYTVVSYKEHLDVSEETTCFSAKICLNGRPIMTVSNQGHGGPHEFWPTTLGLRSEMGKFFDNAKSWCEQFGYKDPHEPGDMWVDWYTQARPYGQTAKMYIGEFVEMIRPTKATA